MQWFFVFKNCNMSENKLSKKDTKLFTEEIINKKKKTIKLSEKSVIFDLSHAYYGDIESENNSENKF